MPSVPYGADYYGWLQENLVALRRHETDGLDFDYLAEELEEMGISQLRALESRLTVLLIHLLKWVHQPARRGASWRNTIIEQRKQIDKLLRRSPSLLPQLAELTADAYDSARRYAETETGLVLETFPEVCPFSPDEIQGTDGFPFGAPAG